MKNIIGILDRSPRTPRSASKDRLQVGTGASKGSTSPKPSQSANYRRTVLVTTSEQESKPTYNNFPVINRTNKIDNLSDDEGDRIKDEMLKMVEEEEIREQRKPMASTKKGSTTISQEHDLDIKVESASKLVHLGI